MKYNVAIIVFVLLGAIVVTDGYIKSRHVEQKVLSVRANVPAMTPQHLASSIAECDPVWPMHEAPIQKSTFCTEVNRTLNEQRLQIVNVPPVPTLFLPQSVRPLRLLKLPIVQPAHPTIPGSETIIFD
jgi:hypothetical protein